MKTRFNQTSKSITITEATLKFFNAARESTSGILDLSPTAQLLCKTYPEQAHLIRTAQQNVESILDSRAG